MPQSEGVRDLLATAQVRIDASPETVFEFFVDTDKMLLWIGIEAELRPVPGGTYRVEVVPGSLALGEYVDVDPPRFVSFTFGWEGGPIPPGASLVRVTLAPEGDGTLVTLEHGGLPDDEALNAHRDGWRHFLERLSIAASGGDPGRDEWGTT